MEQSSRAPLPPEGPTFAEVAVGDPLTAVTRKERLYLLAVSLIGIAMVRTGLVPTKVSTFGIELDKPNRAALLLLLAVVIVYFLVAFIIYAASDYVARREALLAATLRRHQQLQKDPNYASYEQGRPISGDNWIAALRLFFEFVLPVLVGAFAFVSLLWQSIAL